ncbi:MAG: RNA-binding protein [Hyphomicrobiaceae bacterium]|nr:RNA-binding protein [Hyphomicrobiaceae bacterium]
MVRAVARQHSTRHEDDEVARTCALSRQERDRADMIRFVAGPDDVICPDLAEKLPGRGVWITADRVSLEKAARVNPFARSLKRKISVPEDLAGRVERLIVERTIAALALANKSGLVVSGYDKVDHLVAHGDAACLTHAKDGAEGGREKLTRKHFAVCRARGRVPIVLEVLSIDELGLALGRSNVVHAGLKAGGATTRYVAEAGRLTKYRSGIVDAGPDQGSFRLDSSADETGA